MFNDIFKLLRALSSLSSFKISLNFHGFFCLVLWCECHVKFVYVLFWASDLVFLVTVDAN